MRIVSARQDFGLALVNFLTSLVRARRQLISGYSHLACALNTPLSALTVGKNST